ncbi:MAG TPA: hypothetical protein VI248_01280 [Kineosporiaceae bacterium]
MEGPGARVAVLLAAAVVPRARTGQIGHGLGEFVARHVGQRGQPSDAVLRRRHHRSPDSGRAYRATWGIPLVALPVEGWALTSDTAEDAFAGAAGRAARPPRSGGPR